ncbi:MAG: hypothetical protein ACREOI_22680, partial [bacterium]
MHVLDAGVALQTAPAFAVGGFLGLADELAFLGNGCSDIKKNGYKQETTEQFPTDRNNAKDEKMV